MYSDLVLPHLSVRSILTGRTVCGHGVAGQKHFPETGINIAHPVRLCQGAGRGFFAENREYMDRRF